VSARRPRAQAGFTLIELMVSLTLGVIAIGLLLQTAAVTIGGLGRQREAMQLERNARAGIDFLAEAVRNAAPAVPGGEVTDSAYCNTLVAIAVTNHGDAPDVIELISATGGVVTSLRAALTNGASSMVVVDGRGFAPGDVAVVSDGVHGRLLPVSAVTPVGGEYQLGTHVCSAVPLPTAGFAPGALVVRSRYARLEVLTDASGVPLLMVDPDGVGPAAPEVLAEGVEDLQLAVGVDVDGDGALRDTGDTTDEWFYNAAGDAAPPPITDGRWRALRITVTARDLKRHGETARPAAEDRPGGAVDSFARRTLQAQVQIRNLGATL